MVSSRKRSTKSATRRSNRLIKQLIRKDSKRKSSGNLLKEAKGFALKIQKEFVRDKTARKTSASVKKSSSKKSSCSKSKKSFRIVHSHKDVGKKLKGMDGSVRYITQTNGGPQYVVDIHLSCINVYKLDETQDWNEKSILFNKHVLTTPYTQVFIGNGQYKGYKGDAILIHVQKDQYIFVGHNIMTFKTKHAIKSFYGLVGNSAVVYAYAVDDKHTAYLFCMGFNRKEKPFIYRVYDPENQTQNWTKADPHSELYEYGLGFKTDKMKVKASR